MTQTAKTVSKVIDDWMKAHPDDKVAVLVDLMVVRKNFPRAIAAYTGWLLSHRSHIRVGAFATKSFLLRAGLTAGGIVQNKRASQCAMPSCNPGLAPPAFTAPCRNQTSVAHCIRKRHARSGCLLF